MSSSRSLSLTFIVVLASTCVFAQRIDNCARCPDVTNILDAVSGNYRLKCLQALTVLGRQLNNADFTGSSLCSTNIGNSSLVNAIFVATQWSQDSILQNNIAPGSDFSNADISQLQIITGNYTDAKFRGTVGQSPVISSAILVNVDFSHSQTTFMSLSANLLMSDLVFNNAKAYGLIIEGTPSGNTIAPRMNFANSDITNAGIFRIGLHYSVFTNTIMKYIRVTRSSFLGANFDDANVFQSNFQESNFQSATGTGANFDFSTFRNCTFDRANFVNSSFLFVNFRGSNLTGAMFVDSNLFGATDLPGGISCGQFCADPLIRCTCQPPTSNTI